MKYSFAIISFVLLFSCSQGYRETSNVANSVACAVDKTGFTQDQPDSWLADYVHVVSCKAFIKTGFPFLTVVLKSTYSEGLSVEYKVLAQESDGTASIEGSSRDWKSVHLAPNEEIPISFHSIDKNVVQFKLQYRLASAVSR